AQISGDNVAATYQTSILFNAGVVSLLIALKEGAAVGQVTPDQFKQVLTNIRRATRDRAGGIEGLNVPLEVHKLAYSPSEMNVDTLIESYERRICSAMSVSPRIAGLGADPTYNNLSEAINDFWERRIVPERNADAATLNRQWLPLWGMEPSEWRFRFDYSNVPALQENKDGLHKRVRDDWEKQIVDKKQARALLGYAGDDVTEKVFEGVFYKATASAPEPQLEVKAWDESRQARDEAGKWTSGTHLMVGAGERVSRKKVSLQIGEWAGTVDAFIEKFASNPIEHLSAFDSSNNHFIHIIGDKSSAGYPQNMREKVRDGVIIHNHPAPPTAFSLADIATAKTLNVRESKIVTNDGGRVIVLTLTRQGSTWNLPTRREVGEQFQKARKEALKLPQMAPLVAEFETARASADEAKLKETVSRLQFALGCEAFRILQRETGAFRFSVESK
ncbi:MAG: phage portal protein, partial [Armatimonadetes bacterium]|nr:phage portal protein [Armatimonadota bacterium]